MERLLQYWDDLDDVYVAIALGREHIRTTLVFILSTILSTSLLIGCVALALGEPPLAMAFATILAVTLLYRTATRPHFQ